MSVETISLRLEDVKADPYQPRLKFRRIKELGDSYDDSGQLYPIHVDANNILIDGERRLRAALLRKDKTIKTVRHNNVTTVEERDAIRDTLEEHADNIGPVERAWNYARRVVFINTQEQHSPAELMQSKENDYEVLVNLLTPTYDERGQAPSGISELTRQLSDRSGRQYNQKTVYNTTMLVFLSQDFLDAIDDDTIPKSYGYQVPRLYKYPEMMHQVEKEVLNGALKSVAKTEERIAHFNDARRLANLEQHLEYPTQLEDTKSTKCKQ